MNTYQKKTLIGGDWDEVLHIQVFFPNNQSESIYGDEGDEFSKKILIHPGEWQKIVVKIPCVGRIREKRLKLNLLNTRGMIRISDLLMINSSNDDVIWSARASGFKSCQLCSTSIILKNDHCLFFCAAENNSYILLPPIPDLPDVSLKFEACLKVDPGFQELITFWEQCEAQLAEYRQQLNENEKLLVEYSSELNETECRFSDEVNRFKNIIAECRNKEELLLEKEELIVEKEELIVEKEELIVEKEELIVEKERRYDDYRKLHGWLQRLIIDIMVLGMSKSMIVRLWQVGNTLIIILSIGRRNPKKQSAMGTLQQFIQSIESRTFWSPEEMVNMIRQINLSFRELMLSTRWRAGDAIIRLSKHLLLRNHPPFWLTERIKNTLDDFENWQGSKNY